MNTDTVKKGNWAEMIIVDVIFKINFNTNILILKLV